MGTITNPPITIRRADDTSALRHFECGLEDMDRFIHDQEQGLAKYIECRLSTLWLVYEGEKVVAFFALSKDVLVLNHQDRDHINKDEKLSSSLPDKENSVFWERDKYPAIEIDFFAVCKEKREIKGNHLGTAIIESIAQIAAKDPFSSTLFLTVEALHTPQYSTIGFYKDYCGFEFSEKAREAYEYNMRYGNNSTTCRMYKVIIPL